MILNMLMVLEKTLIILNNDTNFFNVLEKTLIELNSDIKSCNGT